MHLILMLIADLVWERAKHQQDISLIFSFSQTNVLANISFFCLFVSFEEVIVEEPIRFSFVL